MSEPSTPAPPIAGEFATTPFLRSVKPNVFSRSTVINVSWLLTCARIDSVSLFESTQQPEEDSLFRLSPEADPEATM